MQKIAMIIVWGAVVVLGAGVGLRWMFMPESAGAEFGISLDGALALNQVRGDLGGVFLALGIITLLGIRRREPLFLEAVAIAIAGVICGRALGVILDGFAVMSVVSIAVEVTLVASLVYTANAMREGAGGGEATSE